MATTGVPVLYGQDAIHGVNYVKGATLYAQPLGVAATFDTTLARELAEITAYENEGRQYPLELQPGDGRRAPTRLAAQLRELR